MSYEFNTHSCITCENCTHHQGRWKQAPDGQAQLDVSGEGVNNSRAKHVAKIWTLVHCKTNWLF